MAVTSNSSRGAFDRRRERLDAGIYFTGTLLQRASLFVALPFLLRRLSTAEYGAFGLLQSALNLIAPLICLNLPATATRLYFDGTSEADRRTIATRLTVLSSGFGLAGALIVSLFITFGRGTTASLLGLPEREAFAAAMLVVVGALGSNHFQMAWALWRARNLPIPTALATGFTGVLFVGLIATLARADRLDVVSAIGAYAGVFAFVGVVANIVAVTGEKTPGSVSYSALAREALRYGIPMLPLVAALWGLGAGGRWIARATLTLDDTGRFTLAAQLATLLSLVGRSAYEAWAPRSFGLFTSGKSAEARAYLHERSRLSVGIVSALGLAIAMALVLVIPHFAPAYAGAAALFPVLAIGALWDVAYLKFQTELLGLKMTHAIPSYTAITLATFAVLGVAGALLFGLWGLAVAYTLAYGCQWGLAQRAVARIRQQSGLAV